MVIAILYRHHQDTNTRRLVKGNTNASPVSVHIYKVARIEALHSVWLNVCHHGFTVLSLSTVCILGDYRVGVGAATSLRAWCVYACIGGQISIPLTL